MGGAISLLESKLNLNGSTVFSHNRAVTTESLLVCSEYQDMLSESGGAISSASSTLLIKDSSFVNNTAQYSGGAIDAYQTYARILGSSSFHSNTGGAYGGAISVDSLTLNCYGNLSFVYNSADDGGAMYVRQAEVTIDSNDILVYSNVDIVLFCKNTTTLHEGGSIGSVSSNITLKGTIHFVENEAINGGAIALFDSSKLNLRPPLNISFILNHALYTGGALYVEDSDYSCSESRTPTRNECFLSVKGSSTRSMSILFVNNSAEYSGSTLYGGELNKCRLWFATEDIVDECGNRVYGSYSDSALEEFKRISKVYIYPPTNLNISSPGQEIKLCQGSDLIIDHNHNAALGNIFDDVSVMYRVAVYPGEQFYIPLIATGQANSAVPAKLCTPQQVL